LVLAQLACSAIFPEPRRERQPSPPGSDPPENPVCYSLLPVGSIFLNPLFARSENEPIRHAHFARRPFQRLLRSRFSRKSLRTVSHQIRSISNACFADSDFRGAAVPVLPPPL
jgi:hypothetical protein